MHPHASIACAVARALLLFWQMRGGDHSGAPYVSACSSSPSPLISMRSIDLSHNSVLCLQEATMVAAAALILATTSIAEAARCACYCGRVPCTGVHMRYLLANSVLSHRPSLFWRYGVQYLSSFLQRRVDSRREPASNQSRLAGTVSGITIDANFSASAVT